jgi:hypothetical protein
VKCGARRERDCGTRNGIGGIDGSVDETDSFGKDGSVREVGGGMK